MSLACDRFASNAAIGDAISRLFRVTILRTVAPRRPEIAAYIRKVVDNWDAETLVKRTELPAGRDGNISASTARWSGGLVGHIIFNVARWFGATG